MATRQQYFGHFSMGASAYRPIDGRWVGQSSFADAAHRWTAPGVARHLHVKLHVAPGLGKSRTINVLVNEVAALTVTISGLDTQGSTTGAEAIAVDDFVCIQHTDSGSPTTTDARVTFVFDHTTTGLTVYGGGGAIIGGGARNTGVISSSGSWDNVGDHFNRNLVPAAGTIDRIKLDSTETVPAGETLDFWITVNGVETGGVHTLTEGETDLDATVTIAFAAGDRVLAHADASWSATGSLLFGIRVTGDDGVSFMCAAGTTSLPSANATRYLAPMQAKGQVETTESAVAVEVALASIVMRDLYVLTRSAVFSISGIDFSVRVNGVSTALAVVTSDIGAGEQLVTSNLTDEVAAEVGDVLAMKFINGADWFQGLLSFGVVQYALAEDVAIGDSVGGVIGPLLWVEWPRLVP